MLVKGARIRRDGYGRSTAAEELLVGDQIFDPLIDRNVEIVDILSRTIRFAEKGHSLRAAFWPLRFGPYALGPQMPQEVVHVSPGQTIFSVVRENGLTVLEQFSASELARQSSSIQTCVMHEVEYIAIFTELPQIMSANGLLLQSYSYAALYSGGPQCGLLNQDDDRCSWDAV